MEPRTHSPVADAFGTAPSQGPTPLSTEATATSVTVPESVWVKLKRAVVQIGAVAGFVASVTASAKGVLPPAVGSTAAVISGAVFWAEHHWAEVKAFTHTFLGKL